MTEPVTERQHRYQIAYPVLWAAIEGAIRDAVHHHPDIVIPRHRVSSIVKRAVGQVLGLQGLGAGEPADRPGAELATPQASDVHVGCVAGAGSAPKPAPPIPVPAPQDRPR